jgi:hypothetical protein
MKSAILEIPLLEMICEKLEELAESLGAKASIYRQLEPLTGHAIMCARIAFWASRNCLCRYAY